MKATNFLLTALVAASTVSASQHQVRSRSDRPAHLVARAPQPTPQFGGLFGGGNGDDDDTTTTTRASSTTDPFDAISSSFAAAASSSAAAAAASSSFAAAAAAASSSSAAAAASASSASASRSAAAASASNAAQASQSAAAAASSASLAASESAAAASSSAAAAASASRASVSAAQVTTSDGLTTTLTATVVATASSVTPSTASVTDTSSGSKSGGGASTGLIVGVSVAGGVLVLVAFIFLYFKFGTRRFSNFDDGDADIKWPELKHDPDSNVMQPLPARRTGGAGFDMGDESDNEGGEQDNGAGMREKRDSFSGSTTALNAAAPGGYAVGEYASGMDHGYAMDPASAYYQDHHVYQQYGMQTSPGAAVAYPDGTNPYAVDPYGHQGMTHPQQQAAYSHGHYQ